MAGSSFRTAHSPLRLTADRPFACLVRHRPTGAVLFSATILDPGSS